MLLNIDKKRRTQLAIMSEELLNKIYKPRLDWSKKGDFGKLLVVGGSLEYTGSPVFNALSALRSGCDLVKIATPEKTAYSIRAYMPDLIAYPLEGDYLGEKHVSTVLEMQKSCDAMVVGGGLGRNQKTLAAVKKILDKTEIPAVVDADALHTVKFRLKKNFIVTPHSQEFFVLANKKLTNDVDARKRNVLSLAMKLKCTVLLKGHVDIISDGSQTAENLSGSPFMTKGGFGDTLAGIAGALLARGVKPFEAACAAAYINGKAGEFAASRLGESMLASDLIEEIHNVIRR